MSFINETIFIFIDVNRFIKCFIGNYSTICNNCKGCQNIIFRTITSLGLGNNLHYHPVAMSSSNV